MAINANSLAIRQVGLRMFHMRPIAPFRPILPLLLAATALAACDEGKVRISSTTTDTNDGGVLKVVEALQCPETQGVLTRKGSAQAGGRVCTYTGPKGAEVSLHLVALDGAAPSEVLRRFEDQLSEGLTDARVSVRAREAAAAGDRAVASASSGDKATVRLPGILIDAEGDKARVRIGGLSINADDSNASVRLRSQDESVKIDASEAGAEIRTRESGDATRSTWILTVAGVPAQAWRMVGYEARGPVGGPLVVATVRTKEREQDPVFEGAKALVTLNVGR